MDKGFSKYNKGGNGYGKREKYNNTKNYSGNNSNKDYIPYIGAPYNFVPLTKKPYELRGGTIAHNDSDSNLLSGEISVRVEAISPILISDGKDHFYRDAYNRIAIPGSSFRGLIRNSVQILGAANVCDDIEDYKFLFREMFNKGINNDRYKNILGIIPIEPKIVDGTIRSVVKNVKAGFIVKTGKGYCIRSPKEDVTKYTGDTNYFSVYDRDIVSKELKIDFSKGCTSKRVSYIQSGNKITSVDVYDRYEKKGWLIDSGKFWNKKVFYIIPQEKNSDEEDIPINEKDIKTYKIDFEKKKNVLGNNRDFYALPEESALKPFFYIQAEGRTYFGFTPHLRLFCDHTIYDGIPGSMKNVKTDYAKLLFGYNSDDASYKSRLSFSDLIVEGNEPEEILYKCVLGEPKASAYMDYLVQDGEKAKTYNSDDFELRGIKQYWLANPKDGMRNNPNVSDNENVQSSLYALPEKTSFSGKVRFHNLRKEELGLLLWSIRLEENSWMNIGKGKPYGLGTIKTQIKDIRVIDDSKAYSLDSFEISPYKDIDATEYIDIYKAFLKDFMGIDWEKDSSIKSFFIMKDSTKIPANKEKRYMTLRDFKEQKKNGLVSYALKSPENIVK